MGLQHTLTRAIEQGLLPLSSQTTAAQEPRPWPVTLLSAVGAWLAAVPLLIFVGMLLGPLFQHGIGAYLVGAMCLAGAGWLMRNSGKSSVFLEQLALPALMVGLGSLGFGLMRDLPDALAAAVLLLIVMATAWWIDKTWLRVLLGVAGAALLALTLAPLEGTGRLEDGLPGGWLTWHVVAATALASLWLQERPEMSQRAVWLEAVGCGLLLGALAGLAWLSGMTFLAGASVGARGGSGLSGLPGPGSSASAAVRAALSCLLVLAAAVMLARRWPVLRRWALLPAALSLCFLAAFMPSLGALCLIAAVCAVTHRWKRAAAAGLAMAWVIGAFYYALAWPLSSKALLLVGVGVVLGVVAWALRRVQPQAAAESGFTRPLRGLRDSLLVMGALATAAVAGWAVQRNEKLIAEGRPSLVELAPVDPRSLMQGDFMTLGWRMPAELSEQLNKIETTQRPKVAASRDERNVLSVKRLLTPGQALQPGEETIELSPKDGRWVIVTDGWFFKEGEGERWQAARYGELRLLPDGRALLVGLRGANLKPL